LQKFTDKFMHERLLRKNTDRWFVPEAVEKDGSYDVYSIDNYSTGKKENEVDNVTYIKGETKNISKLIKFSPSIVYHLGEYSRVEQSFDDMEKV